MKDLAAQAAAALRLVQVDPERARQLAAHTSRQARRHRDHTTAAVAERALGLVAMHLQDLDVAGRHLRMAVRLADRAGAPGLAAEARMSLAFALNRRGRPRQALAEIGAALADLGPGAEARGLAQRAAILQQLGRLDEALVDYRAALPALRAAGDWEWVERVLLNRGVLHAFRSAYGPAVRDLQEAERLCAELGLALPAAFVQENLGFVHSRRGDVPTALRHLDDAESRYRALGAPVGSLLLERSELLLSVRLVAEARQAAEQAVAELTRSRRHLTVPEARLLLARTAVLDGEPALALQEARRAVREFGRQGRPEWVALARYAVLTARLSTGPAAPVRPGRIAAAATELSATGWVAAAVDARLLAGSRSLATGRRTAGRRLLQQVSPARRRGTAATRARAWQAEALLREDAGDRSGCVTAVRTGLRILDEHRATMAATDLRARIGGLRSELVAIGLRSALRTGSARSVLEWAELSRARHLLERPARPPPDPQLAGQLAQLRALVQEITGRQGRGETSAALVQRQVALEREVRDHCRRLPGGPLAGGTGTGPAPAELEAGLDGAALVEFVATGDDLLAVTVAAGRTRLHALGPMVQLADRIRWLPLALRRLSRPQAGAAGRSAALALLHDAATRFDALLLRPLAAELGDRPLVLVPTGVLQSMPWALLPSCRGRPVTVAPSAALWSAASARPATAGRAVVVAGPGLPGAHDEAVQVAAVLGAVPLLGADATVDTVLAALDGAGSAHLAMHGSLRADNPLFSCLQLADGPLTVYDLERLERGPDTVVLAACESARNVVLAGDELLGLSAAFLARDTRRLVASVVPVPDAETAPLMVRFSRGIAGGMSAAAALAQAQEGMRAEEPAAYAAAAGFVCLGAGLAPPAGVHHKAGVPGTAGVQGTGGTAENSLESRAS